MPRSKQRAAHKHHHQNHTTGKHPDKKSATLFTIPVCVIFGLGTAWFAGGSSLIWLLAGAIAGTLTGYFLGKKMDESFSKK